MNKSTALWLHGLFAAFVGGCAGAIETALILPAFAPDKFNFGPDLRRTLLACLVFGILSGIKTSASYLKQSPLPAESLEITATQTQTTKVTATPTDDTKG